MRSRHSAGGALAESGLSAALAAAARAHLQCVEADQRVSLPELPAPKVISSRNECHFWAILSQSRGDFSGVKIAR